MKVRNDLCRAIEQRFQGVVTEGAVSQVVIILHFILLVNIIADAQAAKEILECPETNFHGPERWVYTRDDLVVQAATIDGEGPALDEAEQAVLADILAMREAGETLQGITDALTARGVLTKTGNTVWNLWTVRGILQRAGVKRGRPAA